VTQTALVLLTRYPIGSAAPGTQPDAAIRWHDIAEWLSAERRGKAIDEPVSAHIVDQLLGYLKARRMTVEPVTWELGNGARSLQNLLIMLSEAAVACHVSCNARKIHHCWDNCHYFGFWIDGKRYWFGVSIDAADTVEFSTQTRIDPESARKLNAGYLWESKWVPGGIGWACDLKLASEEVHFFARSLASQKECLEQFLKSCLEAARQIEIPEPPGAPPVMPEEETEQDTEEDEVARSQP
jgi:hypothetical protein